MKENRTKAMRYLRGRRFTAVWIAGLAAVAYLPCSSLAAGEPQRVTAELPAIGKAAMAVKSWRSHLSYSIHFNADVSAEEAVDSLCAAIEHCRRKEGGSFFQLGYRLHEVPRWGEEFRKFFKASRWYAPRKGCTQGRRPRPARRMMPLCARS